MKTQQWTQPTKQWNKPTIDQYEHGNLTVLDLRILKEHEIKYQLTPDSKLNVLHKWTQNGYFGFNWIEAPFENTDQLYKWLGY
jgi:hypothetical protein